ncbi:nickel pincer cofactor biosynthesis protein LarB [Candidatus Bathyarchaeota archaeon]|nr:MAG: nickel pincer cofactor biosynthesis protein LarB [Candidatus Bathyarchaeota archaeon]
MLREVLEKLVKGQISVDEAEKLLRILAIEEIGNLAKIDVGRKFRKGVPEVILAEGKRPEDVAEIALRMLNERERAIISRATREQIDVIKKVAPNDVILQVDNRVSMIVIKKKGFEVKRTGGKVGILTAGTSDISIAEEARVIAEETGCEVITAYDVGVAGIHRLFPYLKEMIEKDVDVIVVVAGREGALPSVVAGMVDAPIVAVPTSIGYGLGEKGISALMAMLQACSLGLAVVNIDGGVAAGAVAALIANRVAKFRKSKNENHP